MTNTCLIICPRLKSQTNLFLTKHILVLSSTDTGCNDIKSVLVNDFKDITENDGNKLSFIGLEISDDSEGNIRVSQKGYIDKLIKEYDIDSSVKCPSDYDFLKAADQPIQMLI